jgi:hypothetical protein
MFDANKFRSIRLNNGDFLFVILPQESPINTDFGKSLVVVRPVRIVMTVDPTNKTSQIGMFKFNPHSNDIVHMIPIINILCINAMTIESINLYEASLKIMEKEELERLSINEKAKKEFEKLVEVPEPPVVEVEPTKNDESKNIEDKTKDTKKKSKKKIPTNYVM